jgi:hypothetical protein
MADGSKILVHQQNNGMVDDPKKNLNGAQLEDFELEKVATSSAQTPDFPALPVQSSSLV